MKTLDHKYLGTKFLLLKPTNYVNNGKRIMYKLSLQFLLSKFSLVLRVLQIWIQMDPHQNLTDLEHYK
jgi:hypothetical protein